MALPLSRRCALGAVLAILARGSIASQKGVNDQEIRIGQSIDLSGPLSEFGQDVANGTRACFNLINENGGIHGRQIKLISLDDNYKVANTVKNVQQLINDDQVFALLHIMGTANTMAILPLVAQTGVPLFAPLTGAQAPRVPVDPNVFNIRASYKDEIEKIVQHTNTLGIKRVSVVYLSNDLGKDGLESVQVAMAKLKMKVHAATTIETDASDAEKAAATLHDARPQAIILITAGKSSVEFIKAYNKLRRGMQFYALSIIGTNTTVRALGPDGVGVVVASVVPFPWSASIPIVKEYQAAMKKIGLSEFSFVGLETYINAKVLAEAIRRSGKDLTRPKLIAAAESIKQMSFGGFDITFGPDVHQGSKRVDLSIIGPHGRFVK